MRVPSNPKESKWRSTSQEQRKRKMIAVTLSDEARAKLEALAAGREVSKSEVVEDLIMRAKR